VRGKIRGQLGCPRADVLRSPQAFTDGFVAEIGAAAGFALAGAVAAWVLPRGLASRSPQSRWPARTASRQSALTFTPGEPGETR
jgi:hypothetical protein